MKIPDIPRTERERQKDLDSLQILDTPAEDRFDRVTRIARRVFDVPIALVSLIDHDRQWLKSSQGLSVMETAREVSFCGHTILGDEVMVVPDTLKDDRFADNPLVKGEPHIRFYAGYPVSGPGGHKVGTLCIIDRNPRQMSDHDLETLRDLAALIQDELRLARLSKSQLHFREKLTAAERKAAIDSLTRTWNRRAILDILSRQLKKAKKNQLPLGVVLVDLDHFKSVNDSYGHPVGDKVLYSAAKVMRSSIRPYDAVGRYGGEEFMVILVESEEETALAISERIRIALASQPVSLEKESIEISVSLGVAIYDGRSSDEADDLISAADGALYKAKNGGRNRVELAQ